MISAASIGLDLKSRSDAAWVDHTLVVLQKFSDMRLLVRRAESASRGYVIANDQSFVREYNESRDQIAPALDALVEMVRDNPIQIQLLEANRDLIARRLKVIDERIRLQSLGDGARIAALNTKAEGRAMMNAISANFDKAVAEEERLLAIRAGDSSQTRFILLAITTLMGSERKGVRFGAQAAEAT